MLITIARWIAWGSLAVLVASVLVSAGAPDLLLVIAIFLLVFAAPVDPQLARHAHQVYTEAMRAHAAAPPEV